MSLKALRFIAMLLAALTLGLGFCHVMQLPPRLGWDQSLWVDSTVRGGLYAAFGSIGAVIDVATVVALPVLAYFVGVRRRPGFLLAVTAAVLFALALFLWGTLVYPVNIELGKWVNGPVPSDWAAYRTRWEWGHVVVTLAEFGGFLALLGSTLADTPRDSGGA